MNGGWLLILMQELKPPIQFVEKVNVMKNFSRKKIGAGDLKMNQKNEHKNLEQITESLKVINGEMGMLAKEMKSVFYLLLFNSAIITAGFIKFMFF